MTMNSIKAATLAVAASGLAAIAAPAGAFDFAGATSEPLTARGAPVAAPASDVGEHGRDRSRDRHRYRGNRYGNRYDDRGYYGEPVQRNTRIWRGRDGQYYCRRENGTTGLLIGAAVGGLVGHEVAGRRDRTIGTLLGAVGGAFLGREIDRSNARCR